MDPLEVGRSRRSVRHLKLVRDAPASVRRRDARRAVNVGAALLGVVVTLPVMLLIAVAIRILSGRPILAREIRVGIDRRTDGVGHWRRSIDYGGRLFTLYSFRTRQVGTATGKGATTAIGGVLERTGLHVLPQLFNVLRGEMNVVGPRPARPEAFVELRHCVRSFSARQRVLPGIIGFGEVDPLSASSSAEVERVLAKELRYLRRMSARTDIRIMLRALAAPFGRRR